MSKHLRHSANSSGLVVNDKEYKRHGANSSGLALNDKEY